MFFNFVVTPVIRSLEYTTIVWKEIKVQLSVRHAIVPRSELSPIEFTLSEYECVLSGTLILLGKDCWTANVNMPYLGKKSKQKI